MTKPRVTWPMAILALAGSLGPIAAAVQTFRLDSAQADGAASSGAQVACCMVANACVEAGYTLTPGGGVAPP